jgi:hypothetical protein
MGWQVLAMDLEEGVEWVAGKHCLILLFVEY